MTVAKDSLGLTIGEESGTKLRVFKLQILEAREGLFGLIISLIFYKAHYLVGEVFGFSPIEGSKHLKQLIKRLLVCFIALRNVANFKYRALSLTVYYLIGC